MGPVALPVSRGVSIGFHVELGEEVKFGEGGILVLVALNVLEGGDEGSGLDGTDDSCDDIKIGLKGKVGYGVLHCGICQNAVNEAGVVGGESAFQEG